MSQIANNVVLPLTIDTLAAGGKAIARHEGMTIFIDRGLPGQTITARITRTKKRYAEAEMESVITPAPNQIEPFCKHFGDCGGCLWQNLPYEDQLGWKQQFVHDTLSRIGGATDITVRPTLGSPEQKYYRNKMEFAFSGHGHDVHLGLRRHNSHHVVDIEQCHLQSGRSVEIVKAVRKWARKEQLAAYHPGSKKGFLRFLVIREPRYSEQCMVQLITAPDYTKDYRLNRIVRELAALLQKRFAGLSAFVHSARQHASQVAYGERIVFQEGQETLTECLGETLYDMGPDSFFQTNTKATEVLYAEALKAAQLTGKELVWDLYTGVGSIALAAAQKAKHVVGFEITEAAIDNAKANALSNGIRNTTFYAGDVRKRIGNEKTIPDVIIVDPPRAGMHEDVVQTLLKVGAKRIVYVSCNPATQARDIGLMHDAYTITTIQPVDLFPHSPHVENIVALERKK